MSDEPRIMSIKDEIEKDADPNKTKHDGAKAPVPTSEKKTPTPSNVMEMIMSPTAKGTLEDYRTHPFNYDGTDATGRIIRGFEGMLGTMNKSIIDIGVGVTQKLMQLFTRKTGP